MFRTESLPANELVLPTVEALSSLTDYYHVEYPRLLAQGLNKKKIIELLEKDEDIVDFHVDRFLDKVPGLTHHPERQQIITAALKEWERRKKPLSKPTEVHQARRSFHAAGAVVKKKPPRHDLLEEKRQPEPERKTVIPPTEASAPVSPIFSHKVPPTAERRTSRGAYHGTEMASKTPSREELTAAINRLTHVKRKLLNILTSFSEMPANQELASHPDAGSSIVTSMSSLFTELKLKRPESVPSHAAWMVKRFELLKEICDSEKEKFFHEA